MKTTFMWKGKYEPDEVTEIKENIDNSNLWREWYQWSDDSLTYFAIMMDIGLQQKRYVDFMTGKYGNHKIGEYKKND